MSNTIRKNSDEIKLNLKIIEDKAWSLKGIVYSEKRQLQNACVKITESNYDPIIHDYTAKNGSFRFKFDIPPIFRMIVSAENHETFSSDLIYKNKICQPLKIRLRKVPSQNVVIGRLVDLDSKPICYANVEIEELNKHTSININGEFFLRNIPLGDYTINIKSPFYNEQSINLKVVENKKIYDFKSVKLDGRKDTGTVNGIIYNENNLPVKNAIVVLVNEEKESVVDYTYTNEEGIYLFGNVPIGRYYIKANK